jgi:ABC-2 type transport system permease protein
LIGLLVARDLKVRYKRSILGFLWTLLSPLFTIMIFAVVFSQLFSRYYKDYKLYMISGVLFWNFFATTTAQGLISVVVNGGITRKINVPKLIFPISVVCSNSVNLLLSFIPLVGFILFADARITIHLLWLPLVMPLLFAFTLGMVLILSTAMVFVRDVRNIWDAVVMIWFFLTPVFYPRAVVPDKYDQILRFNPMLSIIEVCRLPIYLGISPPLNLYLKSALATIAVLSLGLWVFRKFEERFVHYM